MEEVLMLHSLKKFCIGDIVKVITVGEDCSYHDSHLGMIGKLKRYSQIRTSNGRPLSIEKDSIWVEPLIDSSGKSSIHVLASEDEITLLSEEELSKIVAVIL